MDQRALQEFKRYARFSVRVDRYYHAVNTYGLHHESLTTAYRELPPRERMNEALSAPDLGDDVRRFLVVAGNSLAYMGTTNVFSDEVGCEARTDVGNFTFYTCYCFQWTLFELFAKSVIRMALDSGAFSVEATDRLRERWRRTKQFLDLIESGAVFGKTPFRTALPVPGWQLSVEDIDYSDLDEIRELRNQFIHGVESPAILADSALSKQRRYQRSMWILRKFAENIMWEVQRALGHEIGSGQV